MAAAARTRWRDPAAPTLPPVPDAKPIVAQALEAVGPFRQRPPLLGPDLQSMAYDALAKRHAGGLDGGSTSPLKLDVEDDTGDRLQHRVDKPAKADRRPGAPTVLLFHGFGGTATSGYLKLAARAFLDAGHATVRCNNRGCGESRSMSKTPHWPADTRLVSSTVNHLIRERPDLADGGLFLMGFSLGTSAMTHYLAGTGGSDAGVTAVNAGDAPDVPDAVLGGFSVSSPIDLDACCTRLGSLRCFPYRRFLLPKVKFEVLRPAVRASTPDERLAAATAARTVRQFDDALNAPRFGLASAAEFYDQFDPIDALPHVRRPLVVLQSQDDPFIPFAAHRDFDWSRNPHLAPVHTKRGGHCGFHGRGDPLPWCARLAVEALRRLTA